MPLSVPGRWLGPLPEHHVLQADASVPCRGALYDAHWWLALALLFAVAAVPIGFLCVVCTASRLALLAWPHLRC